MFKLKGRYEWKLININTGEVDEEGSKDNLVTDQALARVLHLGGSASSFGNPWNTGSNVAYIFVSSTTPNPLTDYRKVTNMGDIVATAELLETNKIRTGTTYQSEVNFSAPVSPLTIRVIGLKHTSGPSAELLSFIELTTPITQQTDQFLFVRYRIETSYTGIGYGGIFNDFVTTKLSYSLLTGDIFRGTLSQILTPFKNPTDLTKCGRLPYRPNSFNNGFISLLLAGSAGGTTALSSKLAWKYDRSFTISEIPGVLGCTLLGKESGVNLTSGLYGYTAIAASQVNDNPTYSLAFAHAVGDTSPFSNPGNPPLSKGNVLLTGTSNASKIFKKIVLNITQTGNANNTPDVNTGKFNYGVNLFQTTLPLNHIQPILINGVPNDPEEYFYDNGGDRSVSTKMRWSCYAPNDYMYFLHTEGINSYICKWKFNTVEAGFQVAQLNTSVQARIVGTTIWIATTSGLVEFDTLTDSIVATYTTSNGLLSNTCTDIAHDPITNAVWIGHSTGLSQFNTSTKTVTSTHNISGAPFNTLTAPQITVYKGQLSAYNGFVCRGGNAMVNSTGTDDTESPWVFDYSNNALIRIPRTNFTNSRCVAVTLTGNGGNILVESTLPSDASATAGKISVWTVNPVGASFSLLQSTTYDNLHISGISSTNHKMIKLFRISADHFMGIGIAGTTSSTNFQATFMIDYKLNENTAIMRKFQSNPAYEYGVSMDSINIGNGNQYMDMSKIDVDGVSMLVWGGLINSTPRNQVYGWTGSAWSKDSVGTRDIPDSLIATLENNINVDFENAVGFPTNQQFISGENFTFVTGPGRIKTNLQTLNTKTIFYLADLIKVVNRPVVVPAVGPYTYTLPEASNTDYKALETDADYITVKQGLTTYTQVASSPGLNQYSVTEAGVFTFNSGNANANLQISFSYVERH